MFRTLLFSIFVPLLALVPPQANAADDHLYQDAFQPNSSFIRVVAPSGSFASINGQNLDVDEVNLSPYINVMPGEIPVDFAGQSTSIDVAPNRYFSVLLPVSGQPIVVQDDLRASPAKADVTFYNLSGQSDVSLYVPQAQADVFTNIGAASGKSIALNAPLTLDFQVRKGTNVLATASEVTLERRAGVTLLFAESAGAFTLIAAPNRYRK